MSYAINFCCRPSKVNKRGLANIEMSIIINSERTIIALPRKEYPEVFRRQYDSRRGNDIKDFCYQEMSKVQKVITEINSRNLPLNVVTLKEYIKNGYSTSYTIEDLFKDFLRLQEQKIERTEGDGGTTLKTYEKYVKVKETFYSYLKINKVEERSDISKITNSIVVGYMRWLTTDKKFEQSTIAGYMTKLKTIVKYGIANGKITQDPFYGIKVKKGMKAVETVTEEEYKRIVDKHFDIERLEKVRKLLVIAGGCGLAYCDIVKLQPSDFFEQDGHLCLTKQRGKTKVQYWVVIMPEAEKIIRELNFDLASLKLSNQKVNSYAKEIQDILDINSVESLHYYLFRHFFARRLVNSGMPIEIVSKCLGHNSLRTSTHYARLLKNTTLQRVIESYDKIN